MKNVGLASCDILGPLPRNEVVEGVFIIRTEDKGAVLALKLSALLGDVPQNVRARPGALRGVGGKAVGQADHKRRRFAAYMGRKRGLPRHEFVKVETRSSEGRDERLGRKRQGL